MEDYQSFDGEKLKYITISFEKTTWIDWGVAELLGNQLQKFGEKCKEAILLHHRLRKQSRKKIDNFSQK